MRTPGRALALRRAIFDGFAAAAAQELFGFDAAVGAAALEPFEGGELLELFELLVDFSMSCELGLHALVYGAAQLYDVDVQYQELLNISESGATLSADLRASPARRAARALVPGSNRSVGREAPK